MKKFLIVLVIVVLICVLGFGVKQLLNAYADPTLKEDVDDLKTLDNDDGWEIEAEYNYNGTISSNELEQYIDSDQ